MDLASVLATKVIPQLVVTAAQRGTVASDCIVERPPPGEDEVRAIAERAIAQDMPALVELVAEMTGAGLSLRVVLLDAIAPAARYLGTQWEADEITWMDTTLALSMLERLVFVLAHETPPTQPAKGRGLILLFAEPGEQHTLSIRVLGELFRSAGYPTHVDPRMPPDEVVELVRNEHVAMVGMTTTHGTQVESMRALGEDIRRFSRNPNILFLVGGAIENASYAERIGASYCANFQDVLALLRAAATPAGSLQ